jgi:hypothetical protein
MFEGVISRNDVTLRALTRMAKDQHGITRDKKAQEQPTDKEAAQNAGVKEQKDAAKSTPESPGEPAGGE